MDLFSSSEQSQHDRLRALGWHGLKPTGERVSEEEAMAWLDRQDKEQPK